MGRVFYEERRRNIKVPEEADQEPPRAGPKGTTLPWDKIRILPNGAVRLGSISVYGLGFVSAKAAHRLTSHCAGTSGTAKIRIVCVHFVAGSQPGVSENTAGAQKTASVMHPLKQHGDNGSVKRSKRQARTKTLVPQTPAARGHAAKIILQIYALAPGVTKFPAPPIEHPLAIVEMIAARQSGVYAIVNASG
jgi:hypothetical protein